MIKIKLRKNAGNNAFSILFTGDFCPINSTDMLLKKDISNIFGEGILKEIKNTSLNILNLEAPLTRRRKGILKCGPNLKASPAVSDSIKKAGFDIACLANNHIRDFGPEGVKETIERLRKSRIKTFGAGETLQKAAKPLLIRQKGIKASLLAFAENEFSAADNKGGWGASMLNPAENFEAIQKAASANDIVIVLIHGGNEYCPFPSPRTVNMCRSFVRAGASAVIGSHTHVPQGWEIYKSAPIIYSMGNFFFPWKPVHENPFWYRGFSARLNISARHICDMEIIPTIHNRQTDTVDTMTKPELTEFEKYIHKLSRLIKQPKDHKKMWQCWCAMKNPVGWLERILSANWPVKTETEMKNLMALENRIKCEAHTDLGTTFLELVRNGTFKQAGKNKNRLKGYLNGYFQTKD